MKNLRLLLLATLFSFAAGTHTIIHGLTIDDIREQKKDNLINCYEKLNALSDAINAETEKAHLRSAIEIIKDSVEYSRTYAIDSNTLSDSDFANALKKFANASKKDVFSVNLRQLKEIYNYTKNQCKYIKNQIPTKEEIIELDDKNEEVIN